MATDPIIKDHQLWIGFVQPEGLVVSPGALKNAQAVLSPTPSPSSSTSTWTTTTNAADKTRKRLVRPAMPRPAMPSSAMPSQHGNVSSVPPCPLRPAMPSHTETSRPSRHALSRHALSRHAHVPPCPSCGSGNPCSCPLKVMPRSIAVKVKRQCDRISFFGSEQESVKASHFRALPALGGIR